MEQNGIFISYQMAEAIELIEGFNLNMPEEKAKAEESLLELKKRWLNDTLPGTNIKIGDKFTGMQDITIDDIAQISALAKQADTYTLENAGAFQHLLVTNENGQFAFDFEKLDKIASLARKNNKKIIIDSTIVFGDHFPFKIANLDKETISKLIGEYTKQLTGKYGDVIDRIDVLNSIFQRGNVSPGNNAEEFWIKTFGENYGQEVINIVRNNMDSRYPNIKLGWNEFYLTNSNFEQRKIDFLNRVKSINGLDVVGVQDRFMSGESIDYIISSLDEIATVSKETNKEVCITEFGCSVSGFDLRNSNTEIINSKIQNIMNAVKNYSSKSDAIKRIEGRICDKFDFNCGELKNMGFDISTTGRKGVDLPKTKNEMYKGSLEIKREEKKENNSSEVSQTQEKKTDKITPAMTVKKGPEFKSFKFLKANREQTQSKITEHKPDKAEVYQSQVKQNSVNNQNTISNNKVKKLTPTKPNSNGGNSSSNGFVDTLILTLIVGFVAGAIFMIVYNILK